LETSGPAEHWDTISIQVFFSDKHEVQLPRQVVFNKTAAARSYAVSCNRWLAGVRSAPAPQYAGDRISLSDMEHVARTVKFFKLCSRY
jgi:hypothetical protein